MAARSEDRPPARTPLSKERVLQAAVRLADRDGVEALTMRKLAHELGVEAMSLYYHIANKEEILDGVVDVVVEEIIAEAEKVEARQPSGGWKDAVRQRILTARAVLLRHPWAPGVIESRTSVSPAIMAYIDSVLGLLRQGGFSYDLAHHGMHALGSRALGFTQELFVPANSSGDGDEEDDDTAAMLEQMAGQFPNLTGMLAEIAHDDPDATLGWCDDQSEFEFGLDLILDGLERLRIAAS
ncbi:MAG TPA: TetR/AcrR family transcriptional regulator C-terminal domain-containing protein [Acidimicrobiia bacterium]|nr:TetR/AcrR family transcriptional regulator C-terminal domain-containing protein [Acidimicrobiia bacterium]